jgi:hypothetical protein
MLLDRMYMNGMLVLPLCQKICRLELRNVQLSIHLELIAPTYSQGSSDGKGPSFDTPCISVTISIKAPR